MTINIAKAIFIPSNYNKVTGTSHELVEFWTDILIKIPYKTICFWNQLSFNIIALEKLSITSTHQNNLTNVNFIFKLDFLTQFNVI